MPKVRITNLKPGACVINSLKITIPGGGSVTRDASVVGDSDLAELESYGVISVSPLGEEKPQPKPQPAAQQAGTAKPQQGRQAKPRPRPGTDFRRVDPEDQFVVRRREDGSEELVPADKPREEKVVVVGRDGPEVRHMRPGMNNVDGPKYAGDESWQGSDGQGGKDGQSDQPDADQPEDGKKDFTTL